MNYQIAVSNIRKELSLYITNNNIKSLIIGISGGIDSCLCAALARPVCDELNIPLIGRSLPVSSNQPEELERAKLTGKVFCTKFLEHSVEEEYNFMYSKMESNMLFHAPNPEGSSSRIRNGNLKARLRMIYLYDLASYHRGIVLSTDNYTEFLLGFWTLHGDVGDYGMIQNLWKTEVYDMAEWLTMNEYAGNYEAGSTIINTITALATDGLGVTNLGDLGQIMPDWTGNSRDGYKEVDRILKEYLDFIEKHSPTVNAVYMDEINKMRQHSVIQRHLKSQFKRNNPVNIYRHDIIENENSIYNRYVKNKKEEL